MGAASSLVASVFLDIRARMAFVPAIFRALASDPPALERAWLQARALYDDPRAAGAAERLAAVATPELEYRPSPSVRTAVAPFRSELPFLLLIVTSLGLTLDGVFELVPRPKARLPEPAPLPETPVVEYPGEHPLYETIRAVYGTEHVPVMFRALAAEGLLAEAWAGIGPYLASSDGQAHVARVRVAAEGEARGFPEVALFDVERARPTLEQFRIALPQNLVFVTAASRV